MKTSLTLALGQFHAKYGHALSSFPYLDGKTVPEAVRLLRMKLIAEEMAELLDGIFSGDIEQIADGGADLIYVVAGTLISYGIDVDRAFNNVHTSNMTKTPVKVEPGQKYGTKTPKGPDYRPPDFSFLRSVGDGCIFCGTLHLQLERCPELQMFLEAPEGKQNEELFEEDRGGGQEGPRHRGHSAG